MAIICEYSSTMQRTLLALFGVTAIPALGATQRYWQCVLPDGRIGKIAGDDLERLFTLINDWLSENVEYASEPPTAQLKSRESR